LKQQFWYTLRKLSPKTKNFIHVKKNLNLETTFLHDGEEEEEEEDSRDLLHA